MCSTLKPWPSKPTAEATLPPNALLSAGVVLLVEQQFRGQILRWFLFNRSIVRFDISGAFVFRQWRRTVALETTHGRCLVRAAEGALDAAAEHRRTSLRRHGHRGTQRDVL